MVTSRKVQGHKTVATTAPFTPLKLPQVAKSPLNKPPPKLKVRFVNAFKLRNRSMDWQEFGDFATHLQWDEIPLGEVWISEQVKKEELPYLIASAEAQMQAHAEGYSNSDAYDYGLSVDAAKREIEDHKMGGDRPHHDEIIPDVYVRFWKEVKDRKGTPVYVWIVNKPFVRGVYKTDWVEGGHAFVYPWIPENEIWIAGEVVPEERPFILLHEFTERELMKHDVLNYDDAHEAASKAEFAARQRAYGKGDKKALERYYANGGSLQPIKGVSANQPRTSPVEDDIDAPTESLLVRTKTQTGNVFGIEDTKQPYPPHDPEEPHGNAMLNTAIKDLDPQGGEEPSVAPEELEAADFITLPEKEPGTNCGNCRFAREKAKGHVCSFVGKIGKRRVDLRGQSVNDRNCCAAWDNPDALREWKSKDLPFWQHKKLSKVKYGCLMAVLPEALKKEITDWVMENVLDCHLASEGRELDPHVTIKYGLERDDFDTAEQVAALMVRNGPFTVKLADELSLFEGGKDGDVLKVSVVSDRLHELNALVSKSFACQDSFPVFSPHLTLCYLDTNSKVGGHYQSLLPPFLGKEFTVEQAVFSAVDKTRYMIPLSFLPTFGTKNAPPPTNPQVADSPAGFTGEVRYRTGAVHCYNQGQHVPCQGGEAQQPTEEPTNEQAEQRADAEPGGTGQSADGGGTATGNGTGDDRKIPPPEERIVTVREQYTQPADEAVVPDDLKKVLRPHQVQGVAKMVTALDKFGGALLADGTGAGKTSQIVSVASIFASRGKKVLIITPSAVIKPNWKDGSVSGSFAADSERIGLSLKLNQGNNDLTAGEVAISTYENLEKFKGKVDADTIIIHDESHLEKSLVGDVNKPSARALHAFELNKDAGGVMYATATPADKPFHIAYLFRAKVFGDRPYTEVFEEMGLVRKGRRWEINPEVGAAECYRRLEGLFDRLTEDGIMVKREISMKGVPVNFNQIKVPDEAHELMKKVEAAVPQDLNSQMKSAWISANKRRQLEPFKVPHTVDMAKAKLAEGRQVVIFADRVNSSKIESEGETVAESEGTIKLLKDALTAAGITDVAEIHGGVAESQEAKQVAMRQAMDDFQSGKSRVVIATLASGGTGINLDDTVGDKPRTVIMMTAPLGGVDNVQAAGRVWRLNTKSVPDIQYMFSDADIDKWNAGVVSRKMKTLKATTSGSVESLDVPAWLVNDEGEVATETAQDLIESEGPYKWERRGEGRAETPDFEAPPPPKAPKPPKPKPVSVVGENPDVQDRGGYYAHREQADKPFLDLMKKWKKEGTVPKYLVVGADKKTGKQTVVISGDSPDVVKRNVEDLRKRIMAGESKSFRPRTKVTFQTAYAPVQGVNGKLVSHMIASSPFYGRKTLVAPKVKSAPAPTAPKVADSPWDESKHPRVGAGTESGGQFTSSGGGGAAGGEETPTPETPEQGGQQSAPKEGGEKNNNNARPSNDVERTQIEGLKKGDSRVSGEFYSEYSHRLFKLLKKKMGGSKLQDADIQDAVQDSLADWLKFLPKFDPDQSNPMTVLSLIGIMRAIDILRENYGEAQAVGGGGGGEDQMDVMAAVPYQGESPEEIIDSAQEQKDEADARQASEELKAMVKSQIDHEKQKIDDELTAFYESKDTVTNKQALRVLEAQTARMREGKPKLTNPEIEDMFRAEILARYAAQGKQPKDDAQARTWVKNTVTSLKQTMLNQYEKLAKARYPVAFDALPSRRSDRGKKRGAQKNPHKKKEPQQSESQPEQQTAPQETNGGE